MTTAYKSYKWFNPRPATLDEGAKMYRELASKHHPDHGGNTSDMQEINSEWDELKPTLPRFCTKQAQQGRRITRRRAAPARFTGSLSPQKQAPPALRNGHRRRA